MQANTFAARLSIWRMCILSLVMVALVATTAAAASKCISSINVSNKPDSVVIRVQGTAPLQMKPLIAKRYLGFQFAGRLTGKAGLAAIHSGKISCVRYAKYCNRPPLTRVIINASACPAYSTVWNDNRSQVTITARKFGVPAVAKAAKAPQINVFATPAAEMPVLPPAELAGPQGSDPGTPDSPTISGTLMASVGAGAFEEAVSAKPAAPPMRVARLASSAPAKIAQAVVVAAGPVEKKVSLNFLAADINDVLKALASQSGANIVASKDVKGEVTVSLSNVTVDQALDYVAKLSGFGYSKVDGTYLVAPKDALRILGGGNEAEAQSTEVVSVKYANCDDVLTLLKAQCPEVQAAKVSMREAIKSTAGAGGATVEPESKIVLAGSVSSIAAAKLLIKQVDEAVKGDASDQKTAIYQVKYVNVSEMAKSLRDMVPGVKISYAPSQGFDLFAPSAITINSETGAQVTQPTASSTGGGDSLSGGASGASGMGGQQNMGTGPDVGPTKSQSLVISGRISDVDAAVELAKSLDLKTPQVKIESKITSISESGEKKLGLTWSWGDLAVVEDYAESSTGSENVSVDKSLGRWFRQPWGFGAKLDALIKNGDGKLLASPNLLCLEGKPGVFFVGDEVRYITLIDHTQNGTTVSTETANVGIQLRVVAQVNPDGYITMNIHPEVSVLKLTHDQAANIDLPIITRRFTDHTVRVKEGQTIVIGGLINEQDIATMSKIPILGDLPILGNLFRHKETTKDHSQVVVFINASLVAD